MSETPTKELPHYRRPKARQPHACGDCRGRIERGETYHAWSQQVGRRWTVAKRCEDCARLAADLLIEAPELRAPPVGGLAEAVDLSADNGLMADWISILTRKGLPDGLIQPYKDRLREMHEIDNRIRHQNDN